MTQRLQRLHANLRAGNVPCALSAQSGLGTVLHAGTPDSGVWDVLVRDTGGTLLIHDAHGATALPPGSSDTAAANTVKFHVVQAWADQGDAEAAAVIARLREHPAARSAGYGQSTGPYTPGVSVMDAMALFDPLHLFDRMIDVGNFFGDALLAWSPAAASFSLWNPWGTMQGGYQRR